MILRIIPLLLLVVVGAAVLANQDGKKEASDRGDAAGDAKAGDAKAVDAKVDIEPLRGVHVRFKSGDASDTRVDRLIALHVPAGQSPTSFLPAGPFSAIYTGNINVGLRGRYSFSIEGRGKVKVMLAEKVILEGEGDLAAIEPAEKLRLNKGENAFVIEYTSPERGDATMRLYWQSDEFPREAVHPVSLTYRPSGNLFGSPVHDGRELFATMRCVKCHESGEMIADMPQRMAELGTDAPNLTDIGSRLGASWMAHWIQNPKHFRDDATMPRLTAPPQKGANDQPIPSREAWDIAAYLATLGQKLPIQKRGPDAKETIAAGGHLFASLGCIGCHTLPTHKEAANVDDRVPLKWVTLKYHRDALPVFLMNPQAHYAWIRMPNFKLSEEEAKQITAFLWSLPGVAMGPMEPSNIPDAQRGLQLVKTLGCLNCHDLKSEGVALTNGAKAPTLAAISKTQWNRGCVADESDATASGKAPIFGFGPDARQALEAFRSGGESSWRSLAQDTAKEFSARQIAQLQCTACHKRDGENDRWSNHESEVASLLIKPATEEKPKVDDFDEEVPGGEKKEAQIDQSRPDLTWVGEKLKPQWMEQFFAGKLDYKLRPWLTARMPAFPARAKGLAQGLALEHGLPTIAPQEPAADGEAAKLGRQLVGRSIDGKAGFACVQCHGVGTKPAENVFEAQGINFAYSKERLRHEYYMRWMLKPARVQPGTRMPQFAADDGTTPFTDVHGGDGRKQFDAIWQYLLGGRELLAP